MHQKDTINNNGYLEINFLDSFFYYNCLLIKTLFCIKKMLLLISMKASTY